MRRSVPWVAALALAACGKGDVPAPGAPSPAPAAAAVPRGAIRLTYYTLDG